MMNILMKTGLLATRAVIAAILVALVLNLGVGITPNSAEAQGRTIKTNTKLKISKEEWIEAGHAAGAKSVGVYVQEEIVNCSWDDGSFVSCDFKAKECVDTIPIPRTTPENAGSDDVADARGTASDGDGDADLLTVPAVVIEAPVQQITPIVVPIEDGKQ